jgi:hypothetical protein
MSDVASLLQNNGILLTLPYDLRTSFSSFIVQNSMK